MEQPKHILNNLITNIVIIVAGSLGGMVSVAYLMYLIGVAIYISLIEAGILQKFNSPMEDGLECSRGNGFAWLSVLFGGLIGFVGGFVKSPDFLKPLKEEEQKFAVRIPFK